MFEFFRRNKNTLREALPVRTRRFAAASNSRLIDWALSYSKINASIKTDYITVTLRARDLALNNEFVAGFLENAERNVIGDSGFSIQSKAFDAEARTKLENLWREYQSRFGGFVTFDEHQSGRDFDVLVLRTLLIDGEVFIHRAFDPDSKFGWRYEVLDSLEIDPLYNVEDAGNGMKITCGVKYDSRGREVSFFLRESSNDYYMSGPRTEVPASEILHVFRKQFPDQSRGYSFFAPIVLNLGQMDAYKEAEIVHARIQAATPGVWEQNGQPESGDLLDEADDKGEFVREVKAGSIPVAPRGYTLKFPPSVSPNSQFGIFWKNMLRSIANSLGISYNKAAGDYEAVNYSSLREATLEDRAQFEKMQRFLIENWKDFQYHDFIVALAENGFFPVSGIAEMFPHKFFGRRFPWVDPVKEISAKEKEFDLLLTDPITELESRGIDPDELLDRWDEWNTKLKARGVPFMVRPPLTASEPPGQ